MQQNNLPEGVESRFVELPSGRVHYVQAGEGHPVLLLHGSGPGASGWSNFRPNVGALSQRFACYAVDMPGWGLSDSVSGDTKNHVQTALEFMDALGLETAAFVGNSMGGSTAIRFAIEHPERQTHLVAMGAGSSGAKLFGAGDGPTEGLKILRRAYERPGLETMEDLVRVMCYGVEEVSEEILRERLEATLARPDHVANYLAAERNPRDFPAEPALATIKSPTLLIHGRDDRVVHYENSLRLVSVIPNSRLVLLNRCGHWAQLEHADEFNRLVRDFIENA